MSKYILLLIFLSLPAHAITGQQYFQATHPQDGWMNSVVIEARVDSVTQEKVWMVKWEIVYLDGTVETFCKRTSYSENFWDFFAGKGPQTLAYFFTLWQLQPNSTDLWCQ